MLDETLADYIAYEGNVMRGKVVGLEKEFAIVDVGLKMEGRVPLKEFAVAGKPANLNVGDEVEGWSEGDRVADAQQHVEGAPAGPLTQAEVHLVEDLAQVAPLVADPPPVAGGLFPRDPPLLAQHDGLAAIGQDAGDGQVEGAAQARLGHEHVQGHLGADRGVEVHVGEVDDDVVEGRVGAFGVVEPADPLLAQHVGRGDVLDRFVPGHARQSDHEGAHRPDIQGLAPGDCVADLVADPSGGAGLCAQWGF